MPTSRNLSLGRLPGRGFHCPLPVAAACATTSRMSENGDSKPYIDDNGDLIIPFSCADHQYKYWKKEGRALADILAELGVPQERIERMAPPPKKKK